MNERAVVVGSGPNGLVAAVELARRGYEVTVFEGRDTIGGGCRTAELTQPGFLHDVCAAVHPVAAASPALLSLPLERYGLRWKHPATPLAHPIDTDRTVFLHESLEQTAQGLGVDAERYRTLMTPLVAGFEGLVDDALRPLLRIPRRLLLMARFGFSGAVSAQQLADRFETDETRALLAGLAAHSVAPLDRPFTAAIATVLAAAGHHVGWPFVEGGSQRLVDALAAYLRDLGGEIVTGRWIDHVDELGPRAMTFLDVMPRAASRLLGDDADPALGKWRHGPGVFKVDLALDGPVPWADPRIARCGTVHLAGTFEEVAAAEAEVVAGGHPEKPFVLLAQPTVADPSRAPEGKHIVWAYTHVPSASTVDMTTAIEDQIERFAPGFRDRIVARHTMGPAQYEAYNPNNVGGDIGGGLFDVTQILSRPRLALNPYRIAEAVYLCSAATPPGAGTHGLCGLHAVHAAMSDPP